MPLHSPTLLDVAWLDRLGWAGTFKDIELVTFVPLLGAANMNMTEEKVLARLSAEPSYVEMFAAAFPGEPISRRNIELAMATFERSITSGSLLSIAGSAAAKPR